MKRPESNNYFCALAAGAFFSLCSVANASNIYDYAEVPADTAVYRTESLESEPVFTEGGEKGILGFLERNVKYPKHAMESGKTGRVLINFVIEKDGSVTNIRPINDADPELTQEALRVARSMPKWIPGKKNGEPVRVEYTLPFTFKLNGGKQANFPGPFPGHKRNMAIFGNYAKKKDFDGKDMYIFGLKNYLHQDIKITINNKLNTKDDGLESTISMFVLGSEGNMEDAIKEFRGKYTAVKVEATQKSREVDIKEYLAKDGIVCVEYAQISQKDPSVIISPLYVIYDCNNKKVVSLSDLVSPAVVTYLGQQGVDASSCTNIRVDGKTFLVPTPKTVITLDGEKLKANMTELGLSILGIQ